MSIGHNIQRLRKSKGLSQGELARYMDMPQSLIWKYEHDEAVPSVLNAAKLAKFFGVTVEALLKEDNDDRKGDQARP